MNTSTTTNPIQPINGIPTAEVLTMSSREIAELTGKKHNNVTRDLRRVLDALSKSDQIKSDPMSFEPETYATTYLDSYQRSQIEYLLPKDLTLTLVSGYNAALRHSIIQRWMELEAAVTPNFSDPVQSARAWADAMEARRTAERELSHSRLEVSELTPKAEGFDEIAGNTEGLLGLREAAKVAGIQEKRFKDFLVLKGYAYKSKKYGVWLGKAKHVSSGWFQHKLTGYERSDGQGGTMGPMRCPGMLNRFIQHCA